MTTTENPARIEVHDGPDDLATAVAGELLNRLADLQAGGHVPQICLTGGTIAEAVHQEVGRLSSESGVDWGAVEFWFGDERFVAPNSSERNARRARETFLDAVGATRVHEMASTADAADVDAGAEAYAEELRASGGDRFDIVMLGVGPDGHVASLFPGFPQLDVQDRIAVGVTGSPKPPPERISLTFGALRRSASVWFLVSGEGKADAVAKAIAGDDLHQTPAAGVAGEEETIWFLDHASASRI